MWIETYPLAILRINLEAIDLLLMEDGGEVLVCMTHQTHITSSILRVHVFSKLKTVKTRFNVVVMVLVYTIVLFTA